MQWGSKRIDSVADRSGSPPFYLALHRLARSGANVSLAALVVLSAGLFAFAASLRTTELTRNQEAARQRIGADWSLLLASPSPARTAGRLGPRPPMALCGSAASPATA